MYSNQIKSKPIQYDKEKNIDDETSHDFAQHDTNRPAAATASADDTAIVLHNGFVQEQFHVPSFDVFAFAQGRTVALIRAHAPV